MAFQFRKRIRLGRNGWINLSKSGASGSVGIGPFTFNSRGRRSVRLGNGMSYRSSGAGCAVMTLGLLVVGATGVLVLVA
ncbi:MAG: DUF4236 domain-containing protein [Actinobacteria bacterium]|nr:DUF4236 domain-containing protein [Actinomycetota bacterium]